MLTVLSVLLVIWLAIQLMPILFGLVAVFLFLLADAIEWFDRKSRR